MVARPSTISTSRLVRFASLSRGAIASTLELGHSTSIICSAEGQRIQVERDGIPYDAAVISGDTACFFQGLQKSHYSLLGIKNVVREVHEALRQRVRRLALHLLSSLLLARRTRIRT